MQERDLLRSALVCSLVGVAILLYLAEFRDPSLSQGGLVAYADDGEGVVVRGTIESVSSREGLTKIQLATNSSISITAFGEFEAMPGMTAEVRGKVSDYRGKKEVVAQRIRAMS